MRVLYDAQIFRQQRYGGISRYFSELAPRIARSEGASACILAPRHQNMYLRAAGREAYAGWYSRRTRRPAWPLALTMAAFQRYQTARFRPDIVHETYFFGPVVQAPAARRVLTVYDMIHERYPALFEADNPDAGAKRDAVQRADHILCISQSTRRDLMALLGVPADRITVTHLSASLMPPTRPPAPRAGGRPYLLYVGDRGGYKNFEGLLKALALSPLRQELDVVCAGGGAFTAAEQEAIRHHGLASERFSQSSVDDAALAALYAGALCFVYPSLYEGFGIPPLEAMRCGCPVACSNTSSLPEVVGSAAETFDPHDAADLRRALEAVVESADRRAALREAGYRQAATFSWDRCAAETHAAYRQLLATTESKGV